MPVFTKSSSEAGHEGVAVAEVRVSNRGGVIKTKILEAPDAAIGASVETAVKQWSFSPVTEEVALSK
ncbi:MAG: TonB family protein [Bryobacteraceae bacterium]